MNTNIVYCNIWEYYAYHNPLERVHVIASPGLHSAGIMCQKMPPDIDKLTKNCNSNEEIRMPIVSYMDLEETIKESTEIKIILSFFSHFFVVPPFMKPFEAPQRSVRINIYSKLIFLLSGIGVLRVNIY